MQNITDKQSEAIDWYINSLYNIESQSNDWAKNNKDKWIKNIFDSISNSDNEIFINRMDNITKLYSKKDSPSFIFPFKEMMTKEMDYLYKS